MLGCFCSSACSVNGVGFGFELTRETSDLGSKEFIKGYGILLDLRGPTSSLSIGAVERFLLCPASQYLPDDGPLLPDVTSVKNKSDDFQPELCEKAWSYSRQRTGLGLDFSSQFLRLLIGHQRRHVVHINKDLSSTFHVQFNSEEQASGTAILYTTKEQKNE